MKVSTLFWLILMAAIGISWWKDHARRAERIRQLEEEVKRLEDQPQPPIMAY